MANEPTRGGSERWRGVALALLVLAIPAVAAVAGDRFRDVPTDHTFHEDISWLADLGITRGCDPPANANFCPDDPVTRGQMAAFLHRFADTFGNGNGVASVLAGAEGPTQFLEDNTWLTLATVDVTAAADGGAVLVDGVASLFVETAEASGALGLLAATLEETCSDAMAGPSVTWASANDAGLDSTALTGVLPVPRGTNTVRLCGMAIHLATGERTEVVTPTLSVAWFPSVEATQPVAGTDTPAVAERVSVLRERVAGLR